MVILGGMGNLLAVILGAAVMVAPGDLRDFQVYRRFAFGLMPMVLMIFRPNGLMSFEAKPPREEAEPQGALSAEPDPGASPQ
jgi:branched-chain amino acid transport system permease protein